jgi:probable rRNA maturation factor
MIIIEIPDHLRALRSELSTSGLARFLTRARLAIGLEGEAEVLLADDATLRRLNKSFRGKNRSTDVLSFPTPAEIAHDHAGDLAISLETAACQAAAYGHTLRDEIRILLLHGLLHLAGEDHEVDDGEMAAREAVLRRDLRLPTSLIERAAEPSRASMKPSRESAKTATKAAKLSPTARQSAPAPRRSSRASQPTKTQRGRSR